MPRVFFLLWVVFALVAGLAVGGSVVSAWLTPPSVEERCTGIERPNPKCQSAAETKESTEAALAYYTKWLMIGTGVLAAATVALFIATTGLYVGGERQFQLARNEFLSSHRPKMRLKRIWFSDQLNWRLRGPLEVTLEFVNVGNTDAQVNWINYQSLLLSKGQPLPQRPPYDIADPDADTRITRFRTFGRIPSGSTFEREVCDGVLNDEEVRAILHGTSQLYVIGTIEYQDAAGIRQTAFCRRLTYTEYPPVLLEVGRFRRVRDPDYEYED